MHVIVKSANRKTHNVDRLCYLRQLSIAKNSECPRRKFHNINLLVQQLRISGTHRHDEKSTKMPLYDTLSIDVLGCLSKMKQGGTWAFGYVCGLRSLISITSNCYTPTMLCKCKLYGVVRID